MHIAAVKYQKFCFKLLNNVLIDIDVRQTLGILNNNKKIMQIVIVDKFVKKFEMKENARLFL